MFSNREPVARLPGAAVDVLYASSSPEIPSAVKRAADSGAEMIIGGETACRSADEPGAPSLCMDSMTESTLSAVRIASHTLEALQIEHQKNAEFMSLLDYSFDVILKLGDAGRILPSNYRAEKVLGRTADELLGLRFTDLTGAQNSAAMDRLAARYKKHPTFSPAALSRLIRYSWPGNDAELLALLEQACMLARSNLMDEDLLAALPGFRQLIVVTGQEELALRRALDECGGDRVRAAALLGVSRSTLWRRMKKHGLLPV